MPRRPVVGSTKAVAKRRRPEGVRGAGGGDQCYCRYWGPGRCSH